MMTPAFVLLGLRALLAAVLYAFLALILVTLWRDLRSLRPGFSFSPAHLLVADGPQQGQSHALTEINTLGRAADNTVCLGDETVSLYHARLTYHNGQWWFEDLGSRNGSWVNDLVVEQPLVVTHGDTLRLGRVRLRFQAGHAPDASPDDSTKA